MSFRSFVSSVIHAFEHQFKTYNLIEISKSALLANYDLVQKNNPDCSIWPVLKANAYGHGIKLVATALKKRSFPYIVVDSYYEALQIREVSRQPVLLIGATHPSNWKSMDLRNLAIVVYDLDTIQTLGALQKKVPIHLKINTGMNRQGVRPEDVPGYLDLIAKYPDLNLEGICSHLADADGESDNFTQKQADTFDAVVKQVRAQGFRPLYHHLANTAGSAKTTSLAVNAVRLGIGLYGFNPLDKADPAYQSLQLLQPALRFTSTLIKTDSIKAGEKVSYNCTYTFPQDGRIGVLPVGYFEVFDRRLSNKGMVKFVGPSHRLAPTTVNSPSNPELFLPIRGRVCMNLTVVDLLNTEAQFGDLVEIISPNTQDANSVVEMAKFCGTIPYEILVKINETTRRVLVV
jgi:alanine racemase